MKKTTFNRKGYVSETANVKALREMRILYYSSLANAIREAADDEEIVRLTAQACRQAGLPEEPCVQRTIGQDQLSLSADEVRKIFRAAYTAKGVKPRCVLNQKERIARGIANFFSRRYEVRYKMPTISELSAALSQHFQTGAVKGNRGWYMRPKE